MLQCWKNFIAKTVQTKEFLNLFNGIHFWCNGVKEEQLNIFR